jgi:hypothetical protein
MSGRSVKKLSLCDSLVLSPSSRLLLYLSALSVFVSPQRMYLIACLLQLFVEIVFYETTECLLMSFLIPNLVRSEVQSVGFLLRQTIQKVCSATTGGAATSFSLPKASSLTLDAPSYLFVSTSVYPPLPSPLPPTPPVFSFLSSHVSLPLETLRIISHKP